MNATLSVLGLYNYDSTIFDNMKLPQGVNRDDVVSNLLLELAEFEIIYPNPNILKTAISYWSNKEIKVWERLLGTTTIEYDPIANLRRTETYTDKETRDLGGETSHESTTSGITTNTGTDVQKEYVSAFNDDGEAKALAKQTEQALGTGNTVGGHVQSGDKSVDTGTIDSLRTVHLEGSIGVVLTQQMIEAERRVSEFNIINYIIDSFKARFCILIY